MRRGEGGREKGEGGRAREAGEGGRGGREGGRAGAREREVDETWHPGGQNNGTHIALPNSHCPRQQRDSYLDTLKSFGLISDKKKVWTHIWYI